MEVEVEVMEVEVEVMEVEVEVMEVEVEVRSLNSTGSTSGGTIGCLSLMKRRDRMDESRYQWMAFAWLAYYFFKYHKC